MFNFGQGKLHKKSDEELVNDLRIIYETKLFGRLMNVNTDADILK